MKNDFSEARWARTRAARGEENSAARFWDGSLDGERRRGTTKRGGRVFRYIRGIRGGFVRSVRVSAPRQPGLTMREMKERWFVSGGERSTGKKIKNKKIKKERKGGRTRAPASPRCRRSNSNNTPRTRCLTSCLTCPNYKLTCLYLCRVLACQIQACQRLDKMINPFDTTSFFGHLCALCSLEE